LAAIPERERSAGPIPVLHLLNGEQYSGLERLVDHLAAAAPSHGFRLVLALLKPDLMRQRMSSTTARIFEVPMRSRFDLGVADRVAAIAEAAGCRLIHSHTVRSALVARRIQRSTALPWLHHVHSPALHETTHVLRNLANYLAEAAVMRQADQVVTVSQALRSYVRACYRVPRERVAVIPNGVADAIDDRAEANQGGVVKILTLGLFRPRKGIEHLVRAAGLLRDAGHPIRLCLAGEFADAAYEASIHSLVNRLQLRDRVEFTGFVADAGAMLRGCDVFVLPSLKGEGMPMALLEAMAQARPVVASDIDGIREVISDAAGVLVPPAHSRALAQALGRCIASAGLRRRLGQSAQARQRSRHSLAVSQRQMFDCYRSLLGGDPVAGIHRERRP
jgi:glycosyltransferase involved in cell wall biosynthesis